MVVGVSSDRCKLPPCNKFNGQEAYNTDNRLAKSSKSNLKSRRTSAYMQEVRVRYVLKQSIEQYHHRLKFIPVFNKNAT